MAICDQSNTLPLQLPKAVPQGRPGCTSVLKASVARTGVGWTGQRLTGSSLRQFVSTAQLGQRLGPAFTFVSRVLVRADLGAGYCRLFQLLQQLINIEQTPPRGLGESSLCCVWKEEERCWLKGVLWDRDEGVMEDQGKGRGGGWARERERSPPFPASTACERLLE